MRRWLPLLLAVSWAAGCGGTSPSGPSRGTPSPAPAGGPAEDAVPVLDLLGRLPAELWPKDDQDAAKMRQAEAWYVKNAVGRRVTWAVPAGRQMTFGPAGGGTFSATTFGTVAEVPLFGGKWRLVVNNAFTHPASCQVNGLSGAAVERLRGLPADQPLEVVATIKEVEFSIQFGGGRLRLDFDDAAFKGYGP